MNEFYALCIGLVGVLIAAGVVYVLLINTIKNDENERFCKSLESKLFSLERKLESLESKLVSFVDKDKE